MQNIAHISPQSRKESSSFIKAHLGGIIGNVTHYHGGYLPKFKEDQTLPELSIVEKIQFRINKTIHGLNRDEYKVYKQFKHDKINLIFAEYGPTGCALLEISKRLQIPIIVHFHGYDVFQRQCLIKNAIKYARLFKELTGAIAVSKEMLAALIEMGIADNKIIYSPCGCDDVFLSKEIPSDRNGLIAVGRFVEKKGPLLTIKAFQIALAQNPALQLTFIGNGPLLEECIQFVKQNQLENSISFSGNQPHHHVLDRMNASAIFIQHSVTAQDGDREGTPVSVMEAQALGLPVISTFHAGIPDIVKNELSGILVPEFDIEGMSQAILKLTDNPDLGKTFGAQGRSIIERNFTIHHHLANINHIIQRV